MSPQPYAPHSFSGGIDTAERRCPNCGELVPSNSLTCLKCYRRIPDVPAEEKREKEKVKNPSGRCGGRLPIILAAVPGLFGFLGLGQICRDPRGARGYVFLGVGLIVFTVAMLLIFSGFPGSVLGTVSKFLAVPLLIFYAIGYILALADAVVGSALRMFGLRI